MVHGPEESGSPVGPASNPPRPADTEEAAAFAQAMAAEERDPPTATPTSEPAQPVTPEPGPLPTSVTPTATATERAGTPESETAGPLPTPAPTSGPAPVPGPVPLPDPTSTITATENSRQTDPERNGFVEGWAALTGAVSEIWDIVEPTSWSIGYILPAVSPVKGIVTVNAPISDAGANEIWDFTTADGDAANTIGSNLRFTPNIKLPVPIDSLFPEELMSGTVASQFGIEGSRIDDWWNGTAPLAGPDGVVTRGEHGLGMVQGLELGSDVAGLKPRFSPVSIIANARLGQDLPSDSQVLSLNFALNFPLDSLAAGGSRMVGAAALAVAQPEIAAGAMRLAQVAEEGGAAARAVVGMPAIGVGWRLEARFRNPTHPDGGGFDGIYHRGERIAWLSDSFAADQQSPLIPGEENIAASFAARAALDATNAGLGAIGLPPVQTWDDGISPETRETAQAIASDLGGAWHRAEQEVAFLPNDASIAPGMVSTRDAALWARFAQHAADRMGDRVLDRGADLVVQAGQAVAANPDLPQPIREATPRALEILERSIGETRSSALADEVPGLAPLVLGWHILRNAAEATLEDVHLRHGITT